MGIFKGKGPILPENALIGELADNGDMHWNNADFDTAWAMFMGGVLEDRGYRVIEGVYYKLFFLPAPAHNYHPE